MFENGRWEMEKKEKCGEERKRYRQIWSVLLVSRYKKSCKGENMCRKKNGGKACGLIVTT